MRYDLCGWALLIIIGLSAAVCSASDVSGSNCGQWVQEARKAIESVPMKHRYQKTLEEIANACPSISLRLREAAKNSLMNKGKVSKRILLDAAAPYFHPACPPEDPNTPAIYLLRSCSDDEFSEDLLRHLDAATFFYGRALKIEFKRVGIYKNYGLPLIGYLFLTNAAYWEAVENGEIEKDRE